MKKMITIVSLLSISLTAFAGTSWNKYELAIQSNDSSIVSPKPITQMPGTSKEILIKLTRDLKIACAEPSYSEESTREIVRIQRELRLFRTAERRDISPELDRIAFLLIQEGAYCQDSVR